jgi:hypothetical protein
VRHHGSDSLFTSPECAKTQLQAFAISKNFPGVIPPDPLIRGGEGRERRGGEGRGWYGEGEDGKGMCAEGRGRWGKGRERKGVGKGNRRVGLLVPPHTFYQFNHCTQMLNSGT